MGRFFALILSAAILAAALVILVLARPQGAGGWIMLIGLFAGAFLTPALMHRSIMNARDAGGGSNEGGAGLSVEAAPDVAQSSGDEDDSAVS